MSDVEQGNSQLILGGVDPSLFIGTIKYYPIIVDAWYVIAADRVTLGSLDFKLNSMIVDSGTSLIAGSKSVINPIIKLFPSTIECSTISQYPDFTLYISGDAYVLSPEDYIVEITLNDET